MSGSVYPSTTGVTPIGGAPSVSLPTASAGADQTQSDLSVVTLDGSGSSGAESYAWVLQEIAVDGTISTQTGLLSSSTAESPTFTPRELGAAYIATLTATNGDGSASDSTVVSILATAAQVWKTLSLADASAADPNTVLATINTGTGAFTTNATAATFESSAAQPPTYSWDITVDCSTDLGVEVWLEGPSFEQNSATGIAVALVDNVSTTTGTGLMVAMTSNGSAYRVAAGAYHSTLGDANPGTATWEILYGRFTLALVGGSDFLDNAQAWLLDDSSPRDMGNGNNASSGTNATPTFSGGTMKLVLAYQQDATARAGNLGSLKYRIVPRPV